MHKVHCDVCLKVIKKTGIVLALGYIDTHKGKILDEDPLVEFHVCMGCERKVDLNKLLKTSR